MIGTPESFSSDFWRQYPSFDSQDGNTVSALVHGLGILRLLALNRGGLGLSEIAEKTELGKTTAFRLLNTLVQAGYVVQHPETRAYAIDYSILELAGFVLRGIEARFRAGPYLRDLAVRTGLSAVMSVLSRDVVVVVEKVVARSSSARPADIGFRIPAHGSSIGKVILASLPDEALGRFLAEYPLRAVTPKTITDTRRLCDELAEIRERGYAVSDEEWIPRVRSIGAPIKNYRGDVIAGVGLSSHDLLPEGLGAEIGEVLRHVPTLLETAESISYSLGFNAEVLV